MSSDDFDLQLPSGRLRARRHGNPEAPLLVCVPGLSANLASFDFIAERLGGEDLQVVALDLRGRGFSETTPPGTYGWARHAADVHAAAEALGAERFSIIGHSMGGAVAKAAARQNARRIERMAVLDHCGPPEAAALKVIATSVSRLGSVQESVDMYLEQMRSLGAIEPWSEYWDRYFRYELRNAEGGGVTSRTSAVAVFEDGAFGTGAYAFDDDAAVYRLWRYLTMPVLLLRAGREIAPGAGHIVNDDDARRFAHSVQTATVRTIDATHYTIATTEETVSALREFFAPPG